MAPQPLSPEQLAAVRRLQGHDVRTLLCGAACGCVHVAVGLWAPGHLSAAGCVALAYCAGAVLAHVLFMAVHECAHDLVCATPAHNRAAAIVLNLPIVVPFAMEFRRLHRIHHAELSTPRDPDAATALEGRAVGRSRCRKLAYLGCYLPIYAARPVLMHGLACTPWSALNVVAQVCFNAALLRTEPACCAYLLLSALLAGSLHPVAGHFVAEHISLRRGAETQSYYGPLNRVSFNVGYHNEHHDFPRVPGSRLPQLHGIAKAHYGGVPTVASWPAAMAQFVLDGRITPMSRHRRPAAPPATPSSAAADAAGRSARRRPPSAAE